MTQIIVVQPGLGQEWQKFSGNPLFSTVGDSGSWNGSPTFYVLGHGFWDETHAKLYISGYDGQHHSIGLVTATDLDSGWTFYTNNPVLTVGDSGSWDDEQVFGATVLKDGDVYKMWYSGEGSGMSTGSVGIGYALSLDGINWTRHEDNPVLEPVLNTWEGAEVFSPCVIKEGNTYKMWYTGGDGAINKIGYATSPDGKNWTRHPNNPVLDVGPESEVLVPSVWFEGGYYFMCYNGNPIGSATSIDGIVWNKSPSNPILTLGESGEWDSQLMSVLQIVKADTIHLLYFGTDLATQFGVGLATFEGVTSISPDIEISPEWLHENLLSGQSSTQNLTVMSEGAYELSFDVSTDIFFGSSRYNSALHFDGLDDYVAINVPGTNQQLTISLWFKLDTQARTYNTLYRSTERNNPAQGGTGIMFIHNDELHFEIDLGGEFDLHSSISITPEKWYHVAVVWDNINKVRKIYVDGILTGQVNYTPGPLQIGEAEICGSPPWGRWYFKGTIDEVRIWNKACTLAEIRADMHREIDGNTPGLMAYYRFNEGAGNTTFDQTPNGYHATLNRGVIWLPSTTPTIPWLSVAPTSGTLAAGSSMELDVGFDATALFGGNYLAEIIVTSNEPDEPILTIPVELEVTGRPVFSIAVDTVDFGTSFGGFSDSLYLRMTNEGTDTLEIINLVSGDPHLTFAPSALTIPPLADDSLTLYLSVEQEGVFTTTLSFSTNDLDVADVSLPVKAMVLIAPSISVTPDSLHEQLLSGDSSTQKMTISNQGGSDLLFNALVTSSQNYALDLDGYDDYVQVANPSTINGNADFTWSAWIKTGSQVPGAIMAKTTNGYTAGLKSFYVGAYGVLIFHVGEVGSTWGVKPVNDSQWHHVAVTVKYSGDATFRFYVDGVLDNQGKLSNVAAYSEAGFYFQIGYDGHLLFPFIGMIDEVRIWNKVRSLAEIQSDMHREISGAEPGLVAYWRFNETSGNIAFDQTANAHDGSLQGGVMRGPSTAFSPSWLSVTPTSGTIDMDSSQDLELAFNASHLDAGVVTADIVVVSNAPNKPEIRVPIRLDVTATSVEEYSDSKAEVPKNYVLFQNFPNPFNPVTHIRFGLPKAGNVKIELYNVRGECVKKLLHAKRAAGYHIVDVDGGQLASGLYFYKIQADNFVEVKKMILLK